MSDTTVERSALLESYARDGYAIFRNAIDPDLVREAREHYEWLLTAHPDVTPHHVVTHDPHTPLDPFWLRLISDDRLLDIAELFIGPDIALYVSAYFVKEPFIGKAVLWHQDGAFWPLDPMEVVTLWLAVDESSPENGCVRVIPGSHTQQIQPMHESTAIDNFLNQEISVEVDESEAVDLWLQPGDVEVHHPLIFHASKANTSPHRRAGLTIRYIPTSTRITTEQVKTGSAWLRGERGPHALDTPQPFRPGREFAFRGSNAWT
jgi:hypothetical protein